MIRLPSSSDTRRLPGKDLVGKYVCGYLVNIPKAEAASAGTGVAPVTTGTGGAPVTTGT